MQIIHGEQYWDIENNVSAITIILEKVNDAIETKNRAFSHLIVDGIEVYEKHELYLKERINDILNVTIVTLPMNEMIWETMKSVDQYLERAIPALEQLIEKSYETFSSETWTGINQLAEGMQWILQFKTTTQNSAEQPANWAQIEQCVVMCEDSFKQLMDGIETQDTVLIPDILSYEVLPAYKELKVNMAKSLQDEEFIKNAH